MPSIDLNIIDRGTPGSEWTAKNTGIQASQLDKVKENKTDNSNALNSLPTPFARFFVAKEAFRRVTEEMRNAENGAGKAYKRLVSDILDVFELLYYKKFHENQWGGSMKIVVKEWNYDEQMKELHDRVPKLYNALKASYKEDIKDNKLYFVILEKGGKDILLATSSPMTGFVTPPDMDKSDVVKNNTPDIAFQSKLYDALFIPRKGKGNYFRDVVLFGDRDKDFKNYMFQLFGSDNIDARYKELRDYIRLFQDNQDIIKNYSGKIGNITTESYESLVINGLNIGFTDEEDIDNFFQPNLVRLPYRINRDNFLGITYETEPKARNYDFLLPLKSEALSYLDSGKAICTCQVLHTKVIVKFKYNGTVYQKDYDEDSEIVKLSDKELSLNIGLFPNILSPVDSENTYFKVALSLADNGKEWHTASINDVSLSFYKKNDGGEYVAIEEIDSERAKNGVRKPMVRSRQSTGSLESECSTKYYELFNCNFDALEVAIGDDMGFLLPKWREVPRTNESYIYAVDLGTSNTFISRTQGDDDNAPEMFSMREPMVSYLHEINGSSQFSLVANIEDSMAAENCKAMKTEFVPPFIDGEDYKFPIRTVLCKAKNIAGKPVLFDNHNIAFFYEKMMENDFQECLTDIKWEDDEDVIQIFIRELLLMIKCDVLQHGGALNQTSLVWFRPLSFSGKIRRIYERSWKDMASEILFTNNVVCYTESEAPYYYFNKKGIVKNTDAVTVIDIGGGSTDYVYFNANKPVSASSVHFGCDVLWSNGHSGFSNARENGIYKKYMGNLVWEDKDLSKLESEMETNKGCSTSDIINFWLSNSKDNGIIDKLHDDYLPLFAYHFTAIIYFIAKLYQYKEYAAPRTIVFSGNGSRYIDDFVTDDIALLEKVVTEIFKFVYGEIAPIHVVLPDTRKESTCYGGLYRPSSEEEATEVVYHGVSKNYENVAQMNQDVSLQPCLLKDYAEMNQLYCSVLDMLKQGGAIDRSLDVKPFKEEVKNDYEENLKTHYRSEVEQNYDPEDVCNDSVFFIPVIDKIFELTRVYENVK